jgi:hypothetical protein
MRDHRTRPRAAEIVVVGLDRLLRIDPAVTVEVAQQLLLLRIDADDRPAGLEILLLEAGDVLELGIAGRVPRAHRLLLLGLPPTVVVLAE